ncbi:hypothetical protein NM688_g7549 [Phlebia brevispora]|uniref:Uncharacterized protein n=1 Tax=Phlebia brevispora TaxID=194682 RepID=A0ACC1S438_9APHY|nr:hypothetical protein NM688_g7549 [Phlebia brevispora]
MLKQLLSSCDDSARVEIARQEDGRDKKLVELDEEQRCERARIMGILREIEEDYSRRRAGIYVHKRELRARWNETLPIVRLPVELLALVFHEYVSNHWRRFLQNRTTVPPYSWFAILHVCRRWREVALSVHALWTCIVPTRLPCVQFVLSHSGCMQLTVRFGARPDYWDNTAYRTAQLAYKAIVQELHRVRVAELRVCPRVGSYLSEVEKERSGLHMPLVEGLFLSFKGGDSVDIGPLSRATLARLTSLRIHGARSEFVKSLMHATLTSLEVNLDRQVYTADIVAALQQLPALRRLSVSSIGEYDDGILEPEELVLLPKDTSVHLHQLKYLRIVTWSLGVTQFLNSLFFPLDTAIRVEVKDERQGFPIEFIWSSVISKVLKSDGPLTNPSSSGLHLSELDLKQIRVGESYSLVAYVWTSEFPGQAVNNNLLPEAARLWVTFPCRWVDVHRDIREFVGSLSDLPAMTLQDKLPNMECLYLPYDVAQSMVPALVASLPRESHSADHRETDITRSSALPLPPLFPKLELIAITGASFPPGDPTTLFVREFILCLRIRALHGYKIKYIGLIGDNWSTDERKVLENHVYEALGDVIDFARPEDDPDGSDEEEESDGDGGMSE